MKRTAVINIVGLTEGLLGQHTPALQRFRQAGLLARIDPAFPAVTCTAQANYLTGRRPAGHGIVANGWYDRALAEVQFWKQSNHLVTAPKLWDELKQLDPKFTCAQLFWWYNMYSTVDWSITPRPLYPADGRKFFDIYAWPYALGTELKKDLGDFPFFGFWGPAAGVDSPQGPADATSRWIAESAKWIEEKHRPTLNLIYLPHLDYNLQRFGPDDPLFPATRMVLDHQGFFTGDGLTREPWATAAPPPRRTRRRCRSSPAPPPSPAPTPSPSPPWPRRTAWRPAGSPTRW